MAVCREDGCVYLLGAGVLVGSGAVEWRIALSVHDSLRGCGDNEDSCYDTSLFYLCSLFGCNPISLLSRVSNPREISEPAQAFD